MNRRHRSGVLFVLGSAACFATMGPAVKTANALGASIWALLAIRYTVAAAIWLPLARYRAHVRPRRTRKMTGRFVLAGGTIAVASCLEYEAYQRLPIAHVVVVIYLMPVWLAIGLRVFRSTNIGFAQLVSLGMSLLGLALFFPVATPGFSLVGFVLAASASLLGAVFYWLLQDSGDVGVAAGMTPILLTASVLTIPIALSQQGLNVVTNPKIVLLGVGLGVIATVAGMALLFAGIRRLGAFVSSIIGATEPLYAATFAWVLLGEALNLVQVAGGALVLGSVLLVARTSKRDRRGYGHPRAEVTAK